MSAEKELSTPNHARELLDQVIILMDTKGQRYVTGKTLWKGEKVTLLPALCERAKSSKEGAQNFHLDSMLLRATTLNELAIVTLTSLSTVESGLDALRYKIVPQTGLQDLLIECHEIESLIPKIPGEREVELLEMDESHYDPSSFPGEGLDNPIEFGKALVKSISVNMFRQEIERTEHEARIRSLGKFATTAVEADELIVLVRNFAEV